MAQKASLVITVKNEAKGIQNFLDSIISSTVLPNEVIIVDGGSTDDTIQNIEDWYQSQKISNPKIFTLNVVSDPNANRSQGRNIGITKSRNEIVVLTDAGCRVDKYWFEKITKHYDRPEIDYVYGAYEIEKNIQSLNYCSSLLTFNKPISSVDPNFLPSARSVSIKKISLFPKHKFPENLNTAEDLIWAKQINDDKKLIGICELEAIVYWSIPGNLNNITKTFYSYAYGDGSAGISTPHYWRILLKIAMLILIPIIGMINSYFYLLYLFLPITWVRQWTMRESMTRGVNDKIVLAFIIPMLYFVAMIGFLHGLLTIKVRK